MGLGRGFVVVGVVEAAEAWRQAAQRADQAHLRRAQIHNHAEARFARELQPALRIGLDSRQFVAGRQAVGDQSIPAVGGEGQIAHAVRGVECAPDQLAPAGERLEPGHHHVAEDNVRARLVALQSALLDQIVTKPAETIAVLVIAEARPGERREEHIAEAGPIALAVFEAQVEHAAKNQRGQVLVEEECRGDDLGENVQHVQYVGVAGQRQIDQVLDAALAPAIPKCVRIPASPARESVAKANRCRCV